MRISDWGADVCSSDLVVAASCSFYLYFFYQELSQRPNNLNTQDIIVSCVGMVLLLEATRRALGPPLMIIAIIFLGYTFLGPYAPGILAWEGTSFQSVAYHQWISTSGVLGIAVGVSTDMVFLFVLFGGLLDGAGAGIDRESIGWGKRVSVRDDFVGRRFIQKKKKK